MTNNTLGSLIRSLRTEKNMTQVQLADILGVTDKAVSKWERDLSYPDIALFPKLADVLSVTADDLLRQCDEEYRPSRLKQTFDMSPDIRLPLHIILGFTEIIRANHDDPVMLQKYLDGIKASGEYMLSLLDPAPNRDAIGSDLEKHIRERVNESQEKINVSFSGRRILVAEDMEINREIAAEILKQTGAEVEFAENGKVCLDKVIKAPAGFYDLILMDIMMPEMDGLEATRLIRKLNDKTKAGIPIIAMTTNVSENDRNKALDAGMDAFAEKPIFVDRLFETMHHYIS